LNILFLTELFYPHGGGAELATYLYAKLLSEAGFNITVVTNRFPGERDFSRNKNFTIYRLPLFKRRTGIKYSLLWRLDVLLSSFVKKLIKSATVVYIPRLWFSMIPVAKVLGKSVVVHLHDYTPICPLAILYDSSSQAVCKGKSVCSAKCIYQFERNEKSSLVDSMLSLSLNLFAGIPLRKCVEKADAILCVSKAQRDILVEGMPTIRFKTKVVYNPLPDLSPVEIVGKDFGYFGGVNPLKGFEVLRNAMAYLNNNAVRVHVAGCPNINKRMTRSFSNIGMVLHRKLDYDEQGSFYRQIKGVIFPSIVPEPLPYVTAEAMLRARVLIASKIGGIPEQTKNCKGAFLVEAGNYLELAETIEYVNGLNKETVSDLGNQNREVFTKTFNNKKTISEFADTVYRLI